MGACSTSADAPLVAYVSKMVAVPASALPRVAGLPLHSSSGLPMLALLIPKGTMECRCCMFHRLQSPYTSF